MSPAHDPRPQRGPEATAADWRPSARPQRGPEATAADWRPSAREAPTPAGGPGRGRGDGLALAELADRLPLAQRWDGRYAHATLALLCAATVGTLLFRALTFPLLIAACAAFVMLMIMEARRPRLRRRAVIWASIFLLTVAILLPPRESEDVWSYAMYGRMVVHYHADPYRVSPLAFSGDPWFWRVSVWWQDTRTVYGPAFTAVSALGMRLAHDSALRARLFFQLLTAASVAAALLLLDRRGAGTGALAFLGLSPVMVVSVVNGAHNDALVGFAVLGAVVALSGRWRPVAGVALGLGALVKLIALLPAAAVVLWLWRREGTGAAARLAAVLGGVVAGGYLLIGGPGALAPLQEASRLVNHFSLWGPFGHATPLSPAGRGPLGGLLISPVHKLWITGPVHLAGMLLLAALAGVVMLAASSESRPAAGAGATVLAFVLLTSYIQPWYLAAALPVLATQWRSRIAFLGAGYSVLLLLGDAWLNSGGLLKTLLRLPLATAFPLFQLLALAALVTIALRRLRRVPPGAAVVGAAAPVLVSE